MNKTAHTLPITRCGRHERARVFSALTDPAKMMQWFFPMKNGQSKIMNELRLGGKFTIEMANKEMSGSAHGTYLEIARGTALTAETEPPARFFRLRCR